MPGRNPWGWLTDERLTRGLKILIAVVLVLYLGNLALEFVVRVRTIAYIIIGAIFFTYLIYPFVHRLSRRMPMVWAILIVYAGLGLILAGVGYFLVPHIAGDVMAATQYYPTAVARVTSLLNNPNDPLVQQLPSWMRAELLQIPSQFGGWLRAHGTATFGRAFFVVIGTFATIAIFVIIPIISAYLLLDLDNLRNGLAALVPTRRWRATLDLLREIDLVIGGFIRGQLLVALIVGTLITIALLILRVPYAFLLGLLAAVGDLIPYVGAVLAFIPTIATAWFANGWSNALIAVVAFVVIFEAEGHVIAPNIVSRTVRLSPLIVLLALLVGGELAGLVGMLVAVPIAGVLRVIAVRVLRAAPPNESAP